MREAIHLPGFFAVSVGVEHSYEPLVLTSHRLGKEKSLANAVGVLRIPEHLEDLLFFGTVAILKRI